MRNTCKIKRTALVLIAAACLIVTDKAYAQRALPGMRGIEVRGGTADGFYSSDNSSKAGYYFGIGISKYTKNANKWVFAAEYLNVYHPYKESRLPIAQFTGEGGFYHKFFADGSKTFFFSIGGSAMAGYETVNWGSKKLNDGSTIRNRDRFLYGGAITLEMEVYVTDRIVLMLTGRERFL